MKINLISASIIDQLIEISIEAGYEICKIQDSDLVQQIKFKPDMSPVTIADKISHHIISSNLKKLLPGIPIVSEEDLESHKIIGSNQAYWLVDPLDGTTEFIANSGEFTTNIALIENGVTQFGIIHTPRTDNLYWGGSNFAAYKQTDQNTVDLAVPTTRGNLLNVIASKSFINAETAVYIEKLGNANIVNAGSSLKFCLIAEGNADIYPRLGRTCKWDTAAGQAILEGANGYVYAIDGNKLTYQGNGIYNPYFIASNSEIEKKNKTFFKTYGLSRPLLDK